MSHERGAPSNKGMIVQTLTVGTRSYEQRYQLCHKQNCRVCYGPDKPVGIPPGHGPYWYLVLMKGTKRVRLYIGKELDTARFVKPGGEIDWAAVAERRKAWKNRGKKGAENGEGHSEHGRPAEPGAEV